MRLPRKYLIYIALWGIGVALPALVFAGPINNPGSAPFTKLGVYQGVIGIVPATGSVMEIGNVVTSPANGSEIAATGDIYIRPQAGAITAPGNYARFTHAGGGKTGLYVPGPLCLNGQCLDTWANICNFITCGGGPGATPNLDQVLATGNTGSAKTILLNNQVNNAQSFGATSGASLGVGNFAFLAPHLTVSGAYNNLSSVNDSGLFYNDVSGFVVAPWAANSEGLRIAPNGNVGIGRNQPAGKLDVQADNPGGVDRANQLIVRGSTNQNLQLNLGIHTEATPAYGEIGLVEEGVAWRNLVLTKNGGSVGVGGVTNPSAKLVAVNNLSGTGSAGDTIAAYANTANAAIYAQQNNSAGYAGYFSGRIRATERSRFDSGLDIYSNQQFPAPGGYTLFVDNTSSAGYSAGFSGAVSIAGEAGTYTGGTVISGALNVFNTGSGSYGVGIYGQGGAVFGGDDLLGSSGVYGQGRNTTAAGQHSYGVIGGQAIGGGFVGICGSGNCYSLYGRGSNTNSPTARSYAVYGKGGLSSGVGDQAYAGYFDGVTGGNQTVAILGEDNSADGSDVVALNIRVGSQATSTTGGRAIGLYINSNTTGTNRAGTLSKPRYSAYFDGPVVQSGLIIPKMIRGSASISNTCNNICAGAGMFCLLAWTPNGTASEGACGTSTTLMRCMCGDLFDDGTKTGGF